MGCTVQECQTKIDSRDFAYWAAFLQIEPSIESRVDYLAAALGALIGRVEATMGGKPPAIGEKLIQWDKRPEDEQAEFAAWITGLYGKKE